jgi:hypothetical protein
MTRRYMGEGWSWRRTATDSMRRRLQPRNHWRRERCRAGALALGFLVVAALPAVMLAKSIP